MTSSRPLRPDELPATKLAPGEAALALGDAFDALPLLTEGSVDLVITSPPYWGLRTYNLEHDDTVLERWLDQGGELGLTPDYAWYRENGGLLGMEPHPEWYVEHLAELLDLAHGPLTPRGSLWVNIGDTYFARWSSIRAKGRQGLGETARTRRRTPSGGWRHDKQLLLLPARLAIALQNRGWILRNDVIWSKPHVAPRPERDRLRLSHEHLFHFVKRRPNRRPEYFYDLDAVEPGARDVVSVGVKSGGNGHSATFPEELVRPRIASSSPPAGLVVDPFCGTGSTLKVATELGRRALGVELSPSFAGAVARDLAENTPGITASPVSIGHYVRL